jgi:hypothetical protein
MPQVPFLCLALTGCASVWTHPRFETLSADHTSVAVLPIDYTLDRRKLKRGLTPEDIAAEERKVARVLQWAVRDTLVELDDEAPWRVDVQRPSDTNRRLEAAGLSPAQARDTDPAALAALLEVDAIVSGDAVAEQLLRRGEAVVFQVLAGMGGGTAVTPTEDVTVNLRIHGADDGTLLWRCESGDQGDALATPERVTKRLFSECAEYFPYSEDPLDAG